MKLCYHEGVANARIGRWIRINWDVERIGNGCEGQNDVVKKHHDLILLRDLAVYMPETRPSQGGVQN